MVSNRTSISRNITIISITVIFLTLAGAGTYQYHKERTRYLESMNSEAVIVLEKVAAIVTDSFWKYSVAGFERAISYEMLPNDVLAIIVDDKQKANTFSQKHFYLGMIKDNTFKIVNFVGTSSQEHTLKSCFIKHQKIINPGTEQEVIVTIYLTNTFLEKHLNEIILNIFWVFLIVSFMILLTTTLTLNLVVTKPINRFVLKGLELIKSGDFNSPIPIVRPDEIGQLTEGINLMADELRKTYDRLFEHNRNLENRVQERTIELANANDALMKANDELTVARDKAREGSSMKSAFLANMSHELRTPLNAIILYTDLLAEVAHESGQEQNLQDLTKIKQAGSHLLSLIDDILDLAKIEAGKIALHVEETDVPSILSEIAADYAPVVAKNQNTLAVVVDPSIKTMHTDQTRLRQILINLLSNASKFTKEGTITLGVQPGMDAGSIHFFVRDTGVGMNPEQQARIFHEFTQADDSITRKFGGTGLGLTLSQRFSEMLGGKIWVESVEGRGSTFHVLLPRHSRPPAPPPASPRWREGPGDGQKTPAQADHP